MLAQLGGKKLHVALTARPPEKILRNFSFVEFARYAICVAVSPLHPLARSRALTLPQVAREPLIGLTRKNYPEAYSQVVKLFAAAGHKPHFAEEHEDGSSIIAAVEAGRGLALVPSSLACIVGARVKLIPLKPALPPIPVGALWLKENKSEQVKKFIAAGKTP